MLIQCPSCHARTRLPDEHEGTKVRCECGRVFVARARGKRRRTISGLRLGGFLGGLALIAGVSVVRSSGGTARAPEAEPAPVTVPAGSDGSGSNPELVQGIVGPQAERDELADAEKARLERNP